MANDGMTNEMSDARLRELYARSFGAGAGTGTATLPATHPSPEDVLALAQGSLPESRRLALLDHVMACSDCRAEFDMLRAIETAGGERTAQVRPLPSAWRRMAPLAIAASLALVVGTEGWRRSRDGGDEVMRGDANGVRVVSPAGEVAPGAPLTFAWHSVPGARRYDLEVLNADGNVVFSAETRDTVVTGARPETILPGAEYRWWVRAVLEDGAQPRSEPRAFRVRAE